MILALTIWCLLGLAGFVVLMTHMVIDQGRERAIQNLTDDLWFVPLLFIVCIVGGFFTLVGAIFVAYYLPRS